MRRKRLTDVSIRNLKVPAKRIEIPDSQPGLWLSLHPSGRRTFGVRYRRLSDKRNSRRGATRPCVGEFGGSSMIS
jgi:hypothetical protein